MRILQWQTDAVLNFALQVRQAADVVPINFWYFRRANAVAETLFDLCKLLRESSLVKMKIFVIFGRLGNRFLVKNTQIAENKALKLTGRLLK